MKIGTELNLSLATRNVYDVCGKRKLSRHYQLTRCMIPDSTVWSLFEVTIKLFKVAPNELSKIDDHSGLRSVTKFPIGPTGLSLNACSC